MSRDGIINLKGKDFPTWPYVLNAAHEKGLKGITTELLQIPADENGHMAIVSAIAHFPDGDWKAYGDASVRNVAPAIATALIRMAETRAKGRALRDASNIGQTMKEELGDDEPIQAPAPVRPPARSNPDLQPVVPPPAASRPASGPPPANDSAKGCADCGTVLTAGQHTVSSRMFGRSLCPACQKTAGDLAGKLASRPAV